MHGLEAAIEECLGDLVPFLAKFVCFLQIVHGFSTVIWGLFSPFFLRK
jgi:hypothetical protein